MPRKIVGLMKRRRQPAIWSALFNSWIHSSDFGFCGWKFYSNFEHVWVGRLVSHRTCWLALITVDYHSRRVNKLFSIVYGLVRWISSEITSILAVGYLWFVYFWNAFHSWIYFVYILEIIVINYLDSYISVSDFCVGFLNNVYIIP